MVFVLNDTAQKIKIFLRPLNSL